MITIIAHAQLFVKLTHAAVLCSHKLDSVDCDIYVADVI